MSFQSTPAYAGDLHPAEAYRLLSESSSAVLIDVRTRPEWAYVGAPDLSALDKDTVFLEWQTYPSMQRDGAFADRLADMLAKAGVVRGSSLLFICRSGARSRDAAISMTASGWSPCFNVAEGFEGALDPAGHRNTVGGWRVGGLPWKQT